MDVKIIADQDTHLIVGQGNRFAIIERRNNRLYNCHAGKREGISLDRINEIGSLLDASDWTDEATARANFADIVSRGSQYSQTIR